MKKFTSLLILFFCFLISSIAQQRTITGKVVDEKGNPVPAVSVRLKKTNYGVAADNDGVFRIKADPGDVLVLTGGIQTREFTVGKETDVVIKTVLKVTVEEEVFISTAMNIAKRPREVGVANSTLKPEQFNNGNSPRLLQGIAGKSASVTVYNISSAVNSTPRIVIRGPRSITGENGALIVVDGVPVPANTLNYLNPNDVESVTILKGGQAATLYGSDGVNGALIINTKKGGGKPQINFSTTTNFEDVAYLPKSQTEYGSGSGYGLTLEENYRPFENQQYGDRYDGSIRSAGRKLQDGSFQSYPYENIPGIRKKVFALGVSVTNDVSISGGDANSRFYLSVQDANIKGIVPEDQYHRDAVRFNGSRTYGNFKTSFDGTFAFDRTQRTLSNFYFFALNTPSWIPIDKLKDWRTNPFANPNGYFNDYYNNPWFELETNREDARNNYFNGGITLNFKPRKWIEFNYRVGTAITNSFTKGWYNQFQYSEYAKGNLAIKPVTADPKYNDYSYVWRARNVPIPGNVNDDAAYGWRINSDLFVTMDKKIGDVTAKLILGNNIQDRKGKDLNINSTSVIIPDLYNVSNRSGELTGGETSTQQRKVGAFADLTLGIHDYLFLHGSYRKDATSIFYSPNRDRKLYNYGYYGIDVSAIVSDMIPWLKGNANLLNFLKLRASFNKNGNDNLAPYALDATFSAGAGFPYSNLVGATLDNIYPDPGLKPEFVNSSEAGFEASLWKNRINLDVSYYVQDVKNQVFNVALSPSTGYNSTLINAGEVSNRGFEAEFKMKLLRQKSWIVEMNANYSYNTNKVKALYGGLSQIQIVGAGTQSFVFASLGKQWPMLMTTYYAVDSATGKTIVDPADGWPVIGNGLKEQGTTIPKHQLGLGLKVAYKWITLLANAEYRGGNVVYNNIGQTMAFTGSSATTTQYHRQQFVWPNSVYWDGAKYVPNTNLAVRNDLAIYGGWGDASFTRGIQFNGDWFATSAAFWKIRDISLSFAFPQGWYKGLKTMKSIDLSVFGRNLFTFLPKENIYTDPELATLGANPNGIGINTVLNTPPVRQYGLRLGITF